MERAMLLALLAQAEQHIALGKEQINNRYPIIAGLKATARHSSVNEGSSNL